jgi:nucleoid DNA-binding protein
MANEIESEYDQMVRDYLDADPEASLINKKSFVRNLTSTLSNIYQDRKISKIKSRSFTEDTFDIVAEKNRVMEDVKLLALGELDVTTRRRYEKIAKANGYITNVTQNGKQQKIGDIGAFLNEYLPTLERQIKAIEIAE